MIVKFFSLPYDLSTHQIDDQELQRWLKEQKPENQFFDIQYHLLILHQQTRVLVFIHDKHINQSSVKHLTESASHLGIQPPLSVPPSAMPQTNHFNGNQAMVPFIHPIHSSNHIYGTQTIAPFLNPMLYGNSIYGIPAPLFNSPSYPNPIYGIPSNLPQGNTAQAGVPFQTPQKVHQQQVFRKRKTELEFDAAYEGLSEREKLFFQALKQWRTRISSEQGFAVYQVATNLGLLDIVKKQPKSLEELKTLNGWGSARLKSFGRLVLEASKAFLENNK